MGPFILSIIGVLILAVSGWIGGQLVYQHHVGVVASDSNIREQVRVAFR
jgi:uncharacterized membrane protein